MLDCSCKYNSTLLTQHQTKNKLASPPPPFSQPNNSHTHRTYVAARQQKLGYRQVSGGNLAAEMRSGRSRAGGARVLPEVRSWTEARSGWRRRDAARTPQASVRNDHAVGRNSWKRRRFRTRATDLAGVNWVVRFGRNADPVGDREIVRIAEGQFGSVL